MEAGRIEVRFAGAREAVVKLFALAQALTGDYERFEELVGKGERVGMSEALVPAPVAGRAATELPGSSAVALPAVIVDAGPVAVERFLEFFAAAIANGADAGGPTGGRPAGRVGPGPQARRHEGRDAGPDAGGDARARPDRHGDAGGGCGIGRSCPYWTGGLMVARYASDTVENGEWPVRRLRVAVRSAVGRSFSPGACPAGLAHHIGAPFASTPLV